MTGGGILLKVAEIMVNDVMNARAGRVEARILVQCGVDARSELQDTAEMPMKDPSMTAKGTQCFLKKEEISSGLDWKG